METDFDETKPTVLVVDSYAGVLALYRVMFERAGFNCLRALTGKSALVILDQRTADVIITDVMMPGMDGIELTRRLRAREDTKETPILIISARGDAQTILRGMEAGATDYLPKPMPYDKLVALVRELLPEADTMDERGGT